MPARAREAAAMITSVTLKNYKAHRDTTIELGRFTVLVGPNGSGKTSVLEAIDKLARVARLRDDPASAFAGPGGSPRSYARGGVGVFEVGITGNAGADRTTAALTCPPVETASPGREVFPEWALRWSWGAASGDDVNGFRKTLLATFGAATLYRFEARRIAGISVSKQERPLLERDGRNAADVLASLKLSEEAEFDRIQTTLQGVIPGVRRIRIRREKNDKAQDSELHASVIGQKIFLDFDQANDISADDVSEGTLVTLALITALCAGPRSHALLMDDLGLSLHPTAQMELVRQLLRLLREMPDIQIVATTHSPYILDEMKPEDVVVMARRPDGSVASKRLSEHPSAKMSGYVTTGELWGLGNETTWVL